MSVDQEILQQEILDQYGSVWKQDIDWGDMDAFGHVNNVQYFRYLENARLDYFQQMKNFSADVLIVLASTQCRYLKPVVFPDTLFLGVNVVELRQSGLRMRTHMYSQQQQALVSEAEAVVVFVESKAQQKTKIPDEIRQYIINLEAKANNELQ